MRAPKREFRGVWFPREIWLGEGVTFLAKGLLVEIDSLSTNPRGCFASNRYFASFFGVSQSQISRTISELAERNLIEVEIVPAPRTLGGLRRYLRRTNLTLPQRAMPESETLDSAGDDPDEEPAEPTPPLRKMRRPPTHAPPAKCADPLRMNAEYISESRIDKACMHGADLQIAAARSSCVLPDAACMHAPPPTTHDETLPDPADWRADGAGRLRELFGFQSGLAAKLAEGCPSPAYLDAWIRRAQILAAQEGVAVRTKSGLVLKGIRAGDEAPWVPEDPPESGAKGGQTRPLTPQEEKQRRVEAQYQEAAERTRRLAQDLRDEPEPDERAQTDAELRAVKAALAQQWGIPSRRAAQ